MEFSASSNRAMPYINCNFGLVHEGVTVAGINKVSGFKRTTEVVKHRAGGDPSTSRKSPGRTEYDAITFEQGVTHDRFFVQWVNKVWALGKGLGSEVSLADYKRDFVLEVYNEAGQVAVAYKIYRAWVSEYTPMSELDANANAVLISSIKVENEGWEIDSSIAEPKPPSFTTPTS
jgi:phage tail-like protein